MAALGLRQFARCRQLLDWLRDVAFQDNDIFLTAEELVLRIRLLLSQGLSAEAAVLIAQPPQQFPFRGEDAEFRALSALVYAVMGDSRAEVLAREAEEMSGVVEVKTLVPCARAVLAVVNRSDQAASATEAAATTASEVGVLDSLVVAYRSCPELLRLLLNTSQAQQVRVLVLEAHDTALAKRLQTPVRPSPSAGRSGLSPRERDVHALLAQGLTNREIAQALFISESTAKVHIHHIFEKLGVRTRTEAALRLSVED